MSREAVAVAIRGANRITIICHENPDADTLGSALALQMAAERLSKQVEVVAADPVPPALAALPRIGEVRAAPSLEPDIALVTDGPPSRTGAIARDCAEWLTRTTIVNVRRVPRTSNASAFCRAGASRSSRFSETRKPLSRAAT